MQEAEEQDTCRICSAPAEPEQPLFHPCKCSGTIRYIHQDCLTTWLSHSKKKTCDVCKHPYAFTKVYAADMPSRLPPTLLGRRLAQQSVSALLVTVRAVIVGLVWLAFLPWGTLWTWRICFTIGERTAYYISDRQSALPNGDAINPFYYNLPNDQPSAPTTSLLDNLLYHPAALMLSSDIFAGQIIASLIVVTFVAIFLLREWISQNARPDVLEGEDAVPGEGPPAGLPVLAPLPAQPIPDAEDAHPAFPAMDIQDRLALAERQMEAVRAFDDMQNHRRAGQRRGKNAGNPRRNSSAGETSDQAHAIREAKRQKTFERGGELTDRHEHRREQKAFARRLYVARMQNAVRREAEERDGLPDALRQPGPDSAAGEASSSAGPSTWPREFTFIPPEPSKKSSLAPADQTSGPPSPFPQVVVQQPSASLPFSFKQSSSAPVSTASAPTTPIRRPPLPNTFLPPSSSGPSSPVRVTPMLSPSLAMYRPPEDLEAAEAGPSTSTAGYFDDTTQTNTADQDVGVENVQEEMDHFFEEPSEEVVRLESDEERQGSPATDEQEEEEENYEEDDDERLGFQDGEGDEVFEDEMEGEDGGIRFRLDGNNAQPNDGRGDEGQEDAAAANAPDMAQDAAVAAGLNEDMDGAADDDVEGALEAIGMRGPLLTIFQNSMLMMFVLDTAVIIGVMMPFTIGKSTLLLSLDPQRFLQILHLPIRAIRVLTDPLVDTVVFLITKVFAPQWLALLRGSIYGILLGMRKMIGNDIVDKAEQAAQFIYDHSINAMDALWSSSNNATANVGDALDQPLLDHVIFHLEPVFAPFGKEARESAVAFKDWWLSVALGHGTKERVASILVGYAVIALAALAYVQILSMGNKEAGKSVKSFLRQHLLVFKVAGFIFIELVLFPLGCGVVLDLCILWFFSPKNFASRALYLYQAPMTTTFYHWVAGTMFMYSFAILLSGCRSIMRPGAMWFVKDPQDQNSHPIRDILDRSSLTQLRKICMSAFMYTLIVAFTTASAATLLSLGSKSILPFRWKSREPLSNVPVDLLFLHLTLPYTVHYFRPRKTVKKVVTAAWKYIARQLRLTSYFFGGRYPVEEVTPRRLDISGFWSQKYLVDPQDKQDGGFWRVPALDSIALPREFGATAEVTEAGLPVDAHAARLMMIQNMEAHKAKRSPKTDYTVVYIPPNFRYRLMAFMLALWVVGAIALGFGLALPIAIGRGFFSLFMPKEVHDGYSFLAGFYLLWGCYIIGRAIERLDKRRQRRGEDGPRANLATLVFKRGLLWTAQTTYMVLFLGIVIPTLVAIVLDLYLILPLRLATDPSLEPKIRVVDEWALGLLYVKILLHARRAQPHGSVARGLEHIRHNGWTHPDPVRATKEVIAPLTAGLLGMILIPGLAFTGLQYLLPFVHGNDRFLFVHVYPAIFVLAALARSAVMSVDVLASWCQSIRDTEFLVEMRLKNHESTRFSSSRSEISDDESGRIPVGGNGQDGQ